MLRGLIVFWVGFLLLLLGLRVEAKETFIQPFIDSLITDYQSNSSTKKLSAALPLWSLFHLHNFRIDHSKPLLKEVDYDALTAYIEKAVLQPENKERLIEYQLLRLRFAEEKSTFKFDLSTMSKAELAIYHFVKVPEVDHFYRSGYLHVLSLRKSLKYAMEQPGLHGLQIAVRNNLGGFYYHTKQLDSAIISYTQQLSSTIDLRVGRCQYIKGFGVHFNGYHELAHVKMNLGLCHDKLGNLFDAIRYYEEAILDYQNCGSFGGICWSKSQLNNAFLDMGDYRHSITLFKEAMGFWEQYGEPLAYDSDKPMAFLGEYTYYDFKNSASFIDSVLSLFKTVVEMELDYNIESQAFRRAKFLSYRKIVADLAKNKIDDAFLLDTLQAIEIKQQNYDRAAPQLHIGLHNAIRATHLAWQISYNVPQKAQSFIELKKLLKDESKLSTHKAVTNLVWMILHANHKHKEELVLINQKIGEMEANGFIIDLRNVHFQMSKAYEYLGQVDSAFYHYKKHDSLRGETQSLNHHAQLSFLDKKLEAENQRKRAMQLAQENVVLDAKRKRWSIVSGSAVLVLLLVMALVVVSRKKNQAEKLKRQAEFQLLKRDNEQKEHALQNTTVELVKSNTNFAQLLQNIEQLSVEMKMETRKKARSILMDYRVQLQDETWQKFNLDFENANAGFYHELRTRFPSITDSELRISAMHVSGLNNKEISAITGQQISSLHTHKSRLRKKLNVQNDAELMDLLKSLSTT